MPNSTKIKVINILSDVLKLNTSETDDLSKLEYKKLGKWTSIKHIEIIIAVEDEFDIEFEAIDIPMMNSVSKIAQYIDSRG